MYLTPSQRKAWSRRYVASVPTDATRLGGWETVGVVADGALCRVYRAKPAASSVRESARYAIKVLHPRWENVPTAIDTLRREAEVLGALQTEHLPCVLDSHLGEPPYFVVFPWLAGETLAEQLQRGRVDVPTVAWLGRQVAEALDVLFLAGWQHGDVKPANIHVGTSGHVTLLDLGFARRADEETRSEQECVVGSLAYSAPETFSSRLRRDVRSDLYSLGVTLYESLSGRLPFRSDDLAKLVEEHRSAIPTPLRILTPSVPKELAELVHQLLAKTPERRPGSPAEVIRRLIDIELLTMSWGLD